MGRLLPSHPISRAAPTEFREKIDVCGVHLFWTGTLCRTRDTRVRTPAFHGDHATATSAARLAWIYVNGPLTDDVIVVRQCEHERCIAPGCHVLANRADYGEAMAKKRRRVS